MKARILTFLSFTLLSSQVLSNDGQIDPETARAYEGYLLTFVWPEGQSTEQILYKEVISTEDLMRLKKPERDITSLDGNINTEPSTLLTTETVTTIPTPFEKFQAQLEGHVEILSNQQWTLIFKKPGDTISKAFHSERYKDGYPELTGDIAIKLGRYLESDIRYQHYLFDSFTQPDIVETETIEPLQSNTTNSFFFSQPINEPNLAVEQQPELKAFEPSFVLTLEQSNKTASKKLNYLDHPTIGTLLYFEPITLEEAMEKIALQSIPPETGASLDYDDLQSTNELFNREEAFDAQELFSPPVVFE